MRKLKYIFYNFRWVKAMFSPFKPLTVKWYVGKIQVGTPYFYPRKWVKATPELAKKATLDYIAREEEFNKRNPDSARKIKSFDELFQERMTYKYPVPIKIGFDYCGLGWKTKWNEYDIRYEHAPIISFVFFGYQIAAVIEPKNKDSIDAYWESWVCYEYMSDKIKSKQERIDFCREKIPQVWTNLKTGVVTDHWEVILKPKYLKK